MAVKITSRNAEGEAHPDAAGIDGVVLMNARTDKETKFPEFRCKLVVLAIRTADGGAMKLSSCTGNSPKPRRNNLPFIRFQVSLMLERRWRRMLAVTCAKKILRLDDSDCPFITRGRFGLVSSYEEETSIVNANCAPAESLERIAVPVSIRARPERLQFVDEDVASHHRSCPKWRLPPPPWPLRPFNRSIPHSRRGGEGNSPQPSLLQDAV